MAKLTVEKALLRAQSYQKKGEIDQARSLYQAVLKVYPNNRRVKKALAALDGLQTRTSETSPDLSKDQLNALIALYKKGHLENVLKQVQTLVLEHPSSFSLWTILGATNKDLGNLLVAEKAFRKAVQLQPTYPDAHNNLGITLAEQGKLDAAIASYKRALDFDPDHVEAHNNIGNVLIKNGNYADALASYQRVVTIKPDYALAHSNMGSALRKLGKLDAAISAYERALDLKPDYAEAHNNMGNALREMDQLDAAISAYERALGIRPDYAEAHNNLGITLAEQGKLDAAISAYERALDLKPDYAEAHNNMGNALREMDQLDAAIAAYERALGIRPDYAEAHNNLGITLAEQGKLDAAISAYDRALDLKPDYAEAHNNMGNALREIGQLDAAISAYERALEIRPDYAKAHNNIGAALSFQGKLDVAISAYERALDLKPDYAEAHNNMGSAQREIGQLDAAISACERALEIKPDYAKVEAMKHHLSRQICDWNHWDLLDDICSRLGITTKAVPPFPMLSSEDNAAHQLARSQAWVSEQYKQKPLPLSERPNRYPDRLRIGYLSADFFDHAILYLISGLLREYDRAQFEFYVYSYGNNKSGNLRKSAEADVNYFFDVADLSNTAIFDLVRSHCMDIVIDLNGYTKNTRSGIFKYRLAPIQINYLGYPGSMGADYIDYIIADSTVIPEDQRQYYSEKIIYMPHTYQPNDDIRQIADTLTSRTDFGLPETAFVFCCFNNNYKISPREFDIWMRLVSQVEGSVLWLIKSNKWAETNLRKEAAARGVHPSRLIFADKLPHAEHLARHKHADLFLDTFNYNAHTTASDALWAGLPVVTKQGHQFSARVAASLLQAVGLPELITITEAEYEALILELATNPDRLSAIREKLAAHRLVYPLYDTKRYTRNFERALHQAYGNYVDGKDPEDIRVSETKFAP